MERDDIFCLGRPLGQFSRWSHDEPVHAETVQLVGRGHQRLTIFKVPVRGRFMNPHTQWEASAGRSFRGKLKIEKFRTFQFLEVALEVLGLAKV